MEASARDRQIQRIILIEGASNAAVGVLKGFVGLSTGSMAIVGEMVHSLTDLANNVVAWMVVRWSSRPPDEEHPYGHRKFETVAVFLLAMILTVTAFELATRALSRTEPTVLHSSWAAVGMFCVLVANAGLAAWQRSWARRLDSDILRADAHHTFSDVLTTGVAVAGWQAAARGHAWLDTAAALCVAVVILLLAYRLFRRSLPILVDQAFIDPEALRRAVLEVPGVREVRHARSRSSGHLAVVDLVVMVAPELSTVGSHEIATAAERVIRERFPVETVSVHIEPQRFPAASRRRRRGNLEREDPT